MTTIPEVLRVGTPVIRPAQTIAQQQIATFLRICELCARPPRWTGRMDVRHEACAFFLISAPSVAWVEAAAEDGRLRLVDVCIEAMGTFAAIEASIATGVPQLVICGAGPGTLGHHWAIPGGRSQGASVLLLVPRTPPGLAGAVDVQECSSYAPLHQAGADLYDEVLTMDDVAEMPRIALRLRHLFARPQGAMVQLSVPVHLLGEPGPPLPDLGLVAAPLPAPSPATVADVARLLRTSGSRPAFLFGSGTMPFRHRLAALVERWDAVHFSTPPAAAIVPGSLGTIGNAAGGDVPAELCKRRVRCVVALGTRFGTASEGGNDELLPRHCHVVHVDADPTLVPGNAAATRGRRLTFIHSDIGVFLDALSHHDTGAT